MIRCLRKYGLKEIARQDQGFTFLEATISVVLMTVVFLGFTVGLLAFREWINRSWAIRVMDQYANDVTSHIEENLRKGNTIERTPNQNGLGSFKITVVDFLRYPDYQDTYEYYYSAHPTQGVKYAVGNVAPQPIEADFPVPGWKNEHEFTIKEFEYDYLWRDPVRGLSVPNFNEAMAHIYLTIEYRRVHNVETSAGSERNEKYTLTKRYQICLLMKNHLEKQE